MGIIAEQRLPSIKIIGCGVVGLNNVNHQNCNTEDDRRDQSPSVKSSVAVSRLILAIEGLSTAGNRTGKTVLVTLLKQNGNDNNSRADEKNYEKRSSFFDKIKDLFS